jgi:hypothetical protein
MWISFLRLGLREAEGYTAQHTGSYHRSRSLFWRDIGVGGVRLTSVRGFMSLIGPIVFLLLVFIPGPGDGGCKKANICIITQNKTGAQQRISPAGNTFVSLWN